MKTKFAALAIAFALACVPTRALAANGTIQTQPTWWDFQSIDTMKYSRDPSGQFLSDLPSLRTLAQTQISNIAKAGANYVAIATPYDDQFLPVLEVWVQTARANNLHVWFRGNWSGWEGWFGYPKITRQQHIDKTVTFIKDHADLFEDGDVFSACPECENGGPGDPRLNGDMQGHRKFLIDEHAAMAEALRGIDRNVQINFNSMNGDVAKLIMDQATTQALGGIVVIDHYVKSPEELSVDVTDIAKRSGGKVVLGEFGAPIPDIHGQMTEDQQASWIRDALRLLSANPDLYGVNYWTSVGGSTAIWNNDYSPKLAVQAVKRYFSPQLIKVAVSNSLGQHLNDAIIQTPAKTFSGTRGTVTFASLDSQDIVKVSAPGYIEQQFVTQNLAKNPTVSLLPVKISPWYSFFLWLKSIWVALFGRL
ncbi:MAG TPA: hypothetical protein VFG51_02010 [Candidatus Saccharimonadia bacterium]|nr:hypothetical protein [Candidatus Saccharimonadia bacterium]